MKKAVEGTAGPSGLKVDLDYLTDVGAIKLPELAAVHSQATAQIHLSSRNDSAVMRRPGSGGKEKSLAWAKPAGAHTAGRSATWPSRPRPRQPSRRPSSP